jgi:hypothetical protein
MTVNVAAIDKTIARIRANKNFKFNMNSWGAIASAQEDDKGHPCGTSACIAGFAVLADGKTPIKKEDYEYWDNEKQELVTIQIDVLDIPDSGSFFLEKAGDILGLTYDQAFALFLPHTSEVSNPRTQEMVDRGFTNRYYYGPKFMQATEDQAIAVLEHLKATGEVNWTVTGMEPFSPEFYEVWELVNGVKFEDAIKRGPENMTTSKIFTQNA